MTDNLKSNRINLVQPQLGLTKHWDWLLWPYNRICDKYCICCWLAMGDHPKSRRCSWVMTNCWDVEDSSRARPCWTRGHMAQYQAHSHDIFKVYALLFFWKLVPIASCRSYCTILTGCSVAGHKQPWTEHQICFVMGHKTHRTVYQRNHQNIYYNSFSII